jgi:hypothetical protein
MDVCVDVEFQVTNGVLQLRGPRRAAAWPFAGSIAAGNGLAVDSALGLWTPPKDVYTLTSAQGAQTFNADLAAGANQTYPQHDATLINPSTVAPLDCIVVIRANWSTAIPSLSGVHVSLGVSTGGAGLVYTNVASEDMFGAGLTTLTWNGQANRVLIARVPAGGTLLVSAAIRNTAMSGAGVTAPVHPVTAEVTMVAFGVLSQ